TAVMSVVWTELLQPASPMMRMAPSEQGTEMRAPPNGSSVRGLNPERTDFCAHRLVAQHRKERLDGRAGAAAFDQQEVVFLRRDRQEGEAVEARDRLDRDAPVGAALRHRGGDR